MAITAVETPVGFIVTGTTSASDDITDNRIKLSAIYWLTPTTQGHKCAIQDKAGNEIVEFYCDNDNESLIMYFAGQHVDGLYSDDMDSGTLYVFTE